MAFVIVTMRIFIFECHVVLY